MEVTPLMIYLITLADNIRGLLSFIFTFGGILSAVAFFSSLEFDISTEVRIKWIKRVLPALFTCIILFVLIPSSKTLAAMYVIPPIVNNESVQELPAEILSFVKEYLKDLKDE